jgi:hypothetical protein
MENNKKETAVEWLFNQMFDPTYPAGEQMEWLEEAKEMEKEQIQDAYKADMYPIGDDEAEQYYNETYGGGEQ